ncbi:MAG: aminoacyltransferase [Candidatus Saccharibacteria bacterium]|nr:aminoacyltransferase [Candidatus Saccharibacteria bacterium]
MRHFLQSEDWKNFQLALGKTVFEESEPDFSYLAVLEKTKMGNYLYLPYGPTLDEKNPKKSLKKALDSLKALAKKQGCIFVRIEPTVAFNQKDLAKFGLKKSKDLNPADTWLLDLKQDQAEILTNMSQGTRTRHNQFEKKGLTVSVSKNPDDIKYLITLQHKLAQAKHINTFADSYLKTELEQPFASLYLVHYNDEGKEKIVSASLFFDDQDAKTRFYMQSATDPEYKKLPATVGLLSTAIFDAKAAGLETFDFWGIAPEGAKSSHPWAGFTQFKKSFGGFARAYSGTLDLPIRGAKYRLYRFIRFINLKVRKIKA